jgi:hypothetical protein
MICIVCDQVMEPVYDNLEIRGSKLSKPVLKGYECSRCRKMDNTDINRLLIESQYCMDSAEAAYKYKQWSDRYKEVLAEYDKTGLPEGYSFP